MLHEKSNLHRFTDKHLYTFVFLINLILVFILQTPYLLSEKMWPDEALYAWYAKNIFLHPSFIFSKELMEFHPPLFSMLLSLGHFVWPPEIACRFVPLLFSLLGLWAIYILGIRLKSHFVGLFCALALSVNFLYFLFSTYILIDVPLTATCLLLSLTLLDIRGEHPNKRDVPVGLIMAAMFLLKWSGILAIIFVAIYYFFALKEISLRQRSLKLIIPMSITGSVVLIFCIANKIISGKFIPNLSALQGVSFVGPFWYYATKIKTLLTPWPLIPLLAYGLFSLFKENRKTKVLLFSWIMVFFLGISFLPEKTPRYGILIVPPMILLCAIGTEQILAKLFPGSQALKKEKAIAILCLILLLGLSYSQKNEVVSRQANLEFYGFREAGEWLNQYVSSESVVFTTSRRAMRYYSGIDFQEKGGQLTEIPHTKQEFERQIKKIQGSIFLVSDIWMYRQPSWIFPLTSEKFRYLGKLGFRPAHRVFREALYTSGEVKMTAVVRIFQRQ